MANVNDCFPESQLAADLIEVLASFGINDKEILAELLGSTTLMEKVIFKLPKTSRSRRDGHGQARSQRPEGQKDAG